MPVVLDMSYSKSFPGGYVADAYERMFLNTAKGDGSLFVGSQDPHAPPGRASLAVKKVAKPRPIMVAFSLCTPTMFWPNLGQSWALHMFSLPCISATTLEKSHCALAVCDSRALCLCKVAAHSRRSGGGWRLGGSTALSADANDVQISQLPDKVRVVIKALEDCGCAIEGDIRVVLVVIRAGTVFASCAHRAYSDSPVRSCSNK